MKLGYNFFSYIHIVPSTSSPYLDPKGDMELISSLCWLMAGEWQISALCQQGSPTGPAVTMGETSNNPDNYIGPTIALKSCNGFHKKNKDKCTLHSFFFR